MTSPGPINPSSKKPTLFSNIIGTSAAAVGKLLLFQPIDTVATNAMMGKSTFSQFSSTLANASLFSKAHMLYKGWAVEFFKKWPSNSFRFTVQHATEDYIDRHHHDTMYERFGSHAHIASASASGGMTGLLEPYFMQPIDTVQVHQQVYQRPLMDTVRSLSFRDLYRGVGVTSVLRNLPAGITLFGGSEWLNRLMGNEDKHSNTLNIAAKTGAGFGSIAVSQPGDVLKVQMQANRWSLWQALEHVSIKQLFTNGSQFRMMGGIKAGVGFFLAEKAMEWSGRLFGKEEHAELEASQKSNSARQRSQQAPK